MPRWTRFSITLLAITCAALAAAGPAGALQIGIGDQSAQMFSDHRFQALGIGYARLDVPWDVMSQGGVEKRDIQEWVDAAHADGVSPLITFDHSLHRGLVHKLPSVQSFGRQFVRFHKAFPWIKDYAVWDEADYCGEPTCHRAGLVAAYYKQVRRACPACEVVAAELLDEPNMVQWAQEFRRALGREPMVWGLHNYIGANRLQSRSTVSLIRATHAAIWFTETGGLVSRHNHSSTGFPESASHAAKVTEFVFSRLARLSSHVKRIYIYQWNGPGRKARWDSGLIAPNGSPRPAYDVFVRELARFGQLPNTPAARAALASAKVARVH